MIELNNFKEISELANKNKVNFIFGISPGNEEPIDFDKLANKIDIFREIGFKNFCILFDDLLEPGNPIYQANTLNNCRESFSGIVLFIWYLKYMRIHCQTLIFLKINI